MKESGAMKGSGAAQEADAKKFAEPHSAAAPEPAQAASVGQDRAASDLAAAKPVDSAQQAKPASVSDATTQMQALASRGDSAPVPTVPTMATVSPITPDQAVKTPSPAAQIAPALIAVLKNENGTPSVTVRLQPPELGQVQIRIDQTAEGVAHIGITAEKPETLQLLQRDESKLQQALDQAGVQSTGRGISFQTAPPEQVGATASRPDSMQAGAGGSGNGQSGGMWRQSNDQPAGFGAGAEPEQRRARARWPRAGLDITA